MYGMKQRKKESTKTGSASGSPRRTMMSHWLAAPTKRDGGRPDHVAAQHVEGARAGGVDLGAPRRAAAASGAGPKALPPSRRK